MCPLRRLVSAAIVLLIAQPARAGILPPPPPHVRPESADARALLEELLSQSPTAQALVDRLQQADVFVYVRLRWFASDEINGHIGLVPSSGARRLLIVELACRRTRQQQLVALGHELRHAVEIADAPAIVDAATLSAYYRRVGEAVSVAGSVEAFETRAAVEAARRVRAELSTAPPRARTGR